MSHILFLPLQLARLIGTVVVLTFVAATGHAQFLTGNVREFRVHHPLGASGTVERVTALRRTVVQRQQRTSWQGKPDNAFFVNGFCYLRSGS